MTDNLRGELRSIIAKYGLQAVHTGLQVEMRETYNFLRHFYEPPTNNLVIPMGEVIPDRIATPHHKPMKITVASVPEPPELDLSSPKSQEVMVVKEESHNPTLKEVVIQAKREMAQESQEKFSKAKHREEVVKKHKELTEKGIRPESLLTKENLTQWLGQGMSYMRIARELTGVPENDIAVIAKSFGLQSDVKKYIIMKRATK